MERYSIMPIHEHEIILYDFCSRNNILFAIFRLNRIFYKNVIDFLQIMMLRNASEFIFFCINHNLIFALKRVPFYLFTQEHLLYSHYKSNFKIYSFLVHYGDLLALDPDINFFSYYMSLFQKIIRRYVDNDLIVILYKKLKDCHYCRFNGMCAIIGVWNYFLQINSTKSDTMEIILREYINWHSISIENVIQILKKYPLISYDF